MLLRTLWGAALLLIPISLLAQTPPPEKKLPTRPVTELKAVGASLDTNTHDVTVHLQNLSPKTVVAYSLEIKEFDAQDKEIGDSRFNGVGFDWAGPEPNPSADNFIPPGRTVSIVPGKTSPDALSVEATVTTVIYEDATWEGLAQGFFQTRAAHGREAREAAADAQGPRKTELEKRAQWFETHGPKEAQ